eukprot:Awhi_evm1s1204
MFFPGMQDICQALKENTIVTSLKIESASQVILWEIAFLVTVIRSSAISRYKCVPEATKALLDAVIDHSISNFSLINFTCTDKKIIKILTDFLQTNGKLIEVHLAGFFDSEEVHQIFNALKENQSVQKFGFSNELSGIKDMKSLIRALEENKSLTELDLIHNHLGDEEALVLASYLQNNQTLLGLDLGFNNEITKVGLMGLANALSPGKNKTLTTLIVPDKTVESIDYPRIKL